MTFYLGVMLGNAICSSPWTDQLGRKTMLIICQFCSLAIMVANSFSQNYYEILGVILCYGIIFGVSLPIT